MKPNFTLRICRFTVIAIFLIFLIQIGHSQTKDKIELKYKVDSILVGNAYKYSITVKVKNSTGPFTYYLFLGEPWKGGQVLKEMENIQETSYTFIGLSNSNEYHVAVKGVSKRDVNWIYIKL